MARAFLLWPVAVALGGLGTGFLFDAAPGLNWGIWTLAAAGGLLLCARVGGSPMHAALLVPLALAADFGIAAAVTAAPPFHAVIAGGVAVLLAIAVLLAGNPGWEGLTAPFMLRGPVAAPLLMAGEAIRRAFELVGLVATTSGASSRPISSTRPTWSGGSRRTARPRWSARFPSYHPLWPTRCARDFGSATDGPPAAPRAAGSSGIEAGSARWRPSARVASCGETRSYTLTIAS